MRKFCLLLLAAGALVTAGCGCHGDACSSPSPTSPSPPAASNCTHAPATYFLCRDMPNVPGQKTPCASGDRINLRDGETITLSVTPGAIAKWDVWTHHAGENGWRIEGQWVDNLKLSFNPPLNPVFAFGVDEIGGTPRDEWLAGTEDRVPASGTPQDLMFQASEFNRFGAACRTNSVATRIALQRK